MPLLYPHNKLDYNNDSIVSASKIVSARSRERMTDPLRDPDASVVDSLKKSEKLNESINSFKLSFGQLRDLVRLFKSRAVDAIRSGEFDTAKDPSRFIDEIPEPEREQMLLDSRRRDESENVLNDIYQNAFAVPEASRETRRQAESLLDQMFGDVLARLTPADRREQSESVLNDIYGDAFGRVQRDEVPPLVEEEDVGEGVFEPLFGDLSGYGRKKKGKTLRDKAFDYLVSQSKDFAKTLMGGADNDNPSQIREQLREVERQKKASKEYARAYKEELRQYNEGGGGGGYPPLIEEVLQRLVELMDATKDKRKIKVIERAIEKVGAGEMLSEREANYAFDVKHAPIDLLKELKKEGIVVPRGSEKYSKLKEEATSAKEQKKQPIIDEAEDIEEEEVENPHQDVEFENEEPIERYGEKLSDREYSNRAYDYVGDALSVDDERSHELRQIYDRYRNPSHHAPSDTRSISSYDDPFSLEPITLNPKKSRIQSQQPIGDTLTSLLSRIIQTIQRLDIFVSTNIKPYINQLTPDQITLINKSYLFLKEVKTDITYPEEQIDIFKGLTKVASFSSEMIKVFYTEIDKLIFDLLVISKSAGTEYPDINSESLFTGVVDTSGDVIGAGRRRIKKSNIATNFYGEPLGGKAVPSFWSSRMRSCDKKYLL